MSTPQETVTSEQWYCDQCGSRYISPGVCANDHPANELRPISAPAAADAFAVHESALGFPKQTGSQTGNWDGANRRFGPASRRVSVVAVLGERRIGLADRRVTVAAVASPAAQAQADSAALSVVSAQAKAALAAAVSGLEQALTDFKTLIGS